jgi:ABC-type antimicrobial peptide transport system permease subunit
VLGLLIVIAVIAVARPLRHALRIDPILTIRGI